MNKYLIVFTLTRDIQVALSHPCNTCSVDGPGSSGCDGCVVDINNKTKWVDATGDVIAGTYSGDTPDEALEACAKHEGCEVQGLAAYKLGDQ